MSRILYGAPLSPFVRKVRLCLAKKALDHELEVVLPFTPPAWFFDISPLGRIPAFRDGEFTLADSAVICQYLEDAYPATLRLYGQDARQAARIRWLEKYADYEIAPLATFTVFGQRLLKPAMGQASDEVAVRHALDDQLPRHLDYLERELGTEAFFVGDSLSLADLALACQWVNLQYGGEQLDASRWPGLWQHHQRICALPAVQAVLQSEQWVLQKLRDKLAKAE